MIFVDSHCHLDLLAKDQNLADIVARANEAGVKYLQTICTSLDNVADTRSLLSLRQSQSSPLRALSCQCGRTPAHRDEDARECRRSMCLCDCEDHSWSEAVRVGLGEVGGDEGLLFGCGQRFLEVSHEPFAFAESISDWGGRWWWWDEGDG